ncbi:MAG: YlmC/YmxH family sporulation protein [Bacilli bacterium]|nr:YlmC/YmxH family sporulation protein [Bacilli bacterium]
MMLSDLQSKDVVNLLDGKKLGSIIDVMVDKEGGIVEINIQKKRFLFFSSASNVIKWSQIDKIGKDVILVSVKS